MNLFRSLPSQTMIYSTMLFVWSSWFVHATALHPLGQPCNRYSSRRSTESCRRERRLFNGRACPQNVLRSFLPLSSTVSTSTQRSTSFESSILLSHNENATPTVQLKRVAVVGAGAVGSYYGARLWEVGHDVHFYLRGVNYAAAKVNGLNVTSVDGNIHIPNHELQAYDSTEAMAKSRFIRQRQEWIENNLLTNTTNSTNAALEQFQAIPFDWVIVALKSTSLDAIPDLVSPLLSPTTRVLVIMNGMIENDLLEMMRLRQSSQNNQGLSTNDNLPGATTTESSSTSITNSPLQCCRAWYGGMALICCNRIAPAVVDHSYFGLLSAGIASSSKRDKEDRVSFESLFADTVIPVAFEDSLLRGRWKKMIWNLPFNGLSVAMGGITVDQIVTDPGLRRLAYAIMDETIAVANVELLREHEEQLGMHRDTFFPLGTTERAAMMKLSDDMGPYKPSTMLDFVNRRSLEVKYLFRTPLSRAQLLGVPVPHLETIVTQIEAYQRLYNLF